MRSPTVATNKASAALSQTQKCGSSLTSAPRRKPRRRNLSSQVTTRLSPCPEESADHLVTSFVNSSPQCHMVRPYSPMTRRADDSVYAGSTHSHRPVMPPGPPTSPVPSPPHPSTLTSDLAADSTDDVVSYKADSTSSGADKCLPHLTATLRTRLRHRRNAICAHSPLGQGLKDFFASYVMSHLTDSMTSSLNLDSTGEVGAVTPGNSRLALRSGLFCSPQAVLPLSNDTETTME
ncbi:hypothetical protein D915_009499 [Fasciola hepatica]|uniref:Uncharacterized protein n=1 Tax=Fasciola hepatica TaxID=6192 RepID=A0A4E0RCJ9_FASHE|nr:hypothetical protein D915_009499 [Fasciola hepatica]